MGVFPPLRATTRIENLRVSDEERQTNNAAELVAVIAALRRFETSVCKVCVIMDSEYVVLGAGGTAQMATKWLGGLQGGVDERGIVGWVTGNSILHG